MKTLKQKNKKVEKKLTNNKTKRLKTGGRTISHELLENEIQPLMVKLEEKLFILTQNIDLNDKTIKKSKDISIFFNKIITKIDKFENIYPQYHNDIINQVFIYLDDFIEIIKDTKQIIIDGFIIEIENYITENELTGWNYEETIKNIKNKMNKIQIKKSNYLKIINVITQLIVNNNFINEFTEQTIDLNNFYDYLNEYCIKNNKLLEENEEGEIQNLVELEGRWTFWDF